MKEYEVVIDLNSLRFTLVAENEEEAIEQAYKVAIDNYTVDLLRHADYLVEEVGGQEEGECDTCQKGYDPSSRWNRCGECGDCGECCQHAKEWEAVNV